MSRTETKPQIPIAVAGNPNVGKSTLFNNLTGMHQHTGNWPGKTVACAKGVYHGRKRDFLFIDLPGTYSLMSHSAEEEIARDCICFGEAAVTVVVCDATCLERNLNLALQIMEMTRSVILCVNMMDEAQRRGVSVDANLLSSLLGVPVVTTAARKKRTLKQLIRAIDGVVDGEVVCAPLTVNYGADCERAVSTVQRVIEAKLPHSNARWIAVKLLEGCAELIKHISSALSFDFLSDPDVTNALSAANVNEAFRDITASRTVETAQQIADKAVRKTAKKGSFDERADRILTGKYTAYPVMILLLALVFWLTISGANYPSALLSSLFDKGQRLLTALFIKAGAPVWLREPLISGVYRVLGWVVSVMLPPMAVFFPLFTLLEDVGYLPRIAYNLDRPFKRCSACGKQALTMCMGFGCNAAGVVGCRIIDSPRERLIAVLTNVFVPCNGRFPMLITMIGAFFAVSTGLVQSAASALILTAVIVTGIALTFASSKLLSKTVLKGVPSSFTLELPPYRRPQVGKILLRSVFDRTMFVLGRAAAVAAPAGLIIWIMANVTVSGASLLSHCAGFLDPFGRLLGMDGVILTAFILGSPANEIVIPIMIMAYTAATDLNGITGVAALRELLAANGWTQATAVSVMLFSLCHWPCTTTLLTIRKETGSFLWTAVSALLPTVVGITLCLIFNLLMRCLL